MVAGLILRRGWMEANILTGLDADIALGTRNKIVQAIPTAARTFDLPPANTAPLRYIIVNDGSSGFTATLARSAGDTIDGAAADLSLADGESVEMISDGVSDWIICGQVVTELKAAVFEISVAGTISTGALGFNPLAVWAGAMVIENPSVSNPFTGTTWGFAIGLTSASEAKGVTRGTSGGNTAYAGDSNDITGSTHADGSTSFDQHRWEVTQFNSSGIVLTSLGTTIDAISLPHVLLVIGIGVK